jgi:hypothetical protein
MKRRFLIFLISCGAVYPQQNALILPWVPQQFTNTNGTPLANGKVCTYQAGTSTGLATYTDSTASVANSVPPNAILLDSTGRPTSGGIWLKSPLAYKIVVMTAGTDSTCSTGVTIKTQDQVVTGSGAGLNLNNTFTGTNTFTGPHTLTGLTSIKNQSNVRWVDGTSYACSDVGLNAAIADTIAANAAGGTVYASCPGTRTIAATVNVGSATANVALVLLGQTVWNCTINNAAQDCWFVFSNSSIEGPNHGVNFQQLTVSAGASVRSIVKTFSHVTPGVATHFKLSGLEIHNQSNGTIANAVVDVQGAYDSSFWNLTIDHFGGRGLWIHDFTAPAGGNSLALYNTLLDGQHVSGARPLVIEQNNGATANLSGVHFFGGDFGHPGAGQFLIELNGHGTGGFGLVGFSDIYMESNNTDTTTALIKVADVLQVNFNNVRMTRLSGSSTAAGIAVSESAVNLTGNIGAKNIQVGGGSGCNSTNIITNSVPGSGTGNVSTGSCALSDYSFLSSEIGDQSQIGSQWQFPNSSTLFGNVSSARSNSITPNFPVYIFQAAAIPTGLAIAQNTISEWRIGMPASSANFCFGLNDTLTSCAATLTTGGVLTDVNGLSFTKTIASGTATMTTAAIGSLACGTTVTVSATGVTTTDTITQAFNAAPAANPGELVVSAWPTANKVNFQYCNPTAGSVTPAAATLNWRVVR